MIPAGNMIPAGGVSKSESIHWYSIESRIPICKARYGLAQQESTTRSAISLTILSW